MAVTAEELRKSPSEAQAAYLRAKRELHPFNTL